MGPNHVLDKGFLATTAVGRFRAVTLTSSDKVKQSDTAGAITMGISQEESPLADANKRTINVRTMGISRAIASAAIALDAKVKTTNDGRMVTAASGDECVGRAITVAAQANDQIDVFLTPGAKA